MRQELLALAWAIFLAEGDCRASVPFGYLPLRSSWRSRRIPFRRVLDAVLAELELELSRYKSASNFQGDFIHWLARVGYNANPAEWNAWERNVRWFYRHLTGSDKIP